jgi:ABC-type glycerol-3-phosphate transport system substrate-binding protein
MSLWRSPEFTGAMKGAGDNFVEASLASLEQDTDVEWRPRLPQWPAVGETMATAIQTALAGQKKSKDALDEAQTRISQILKA